MGEMTSQTTNLTVVYSTVYSGADQRKHESSALLAFVWEFTGEFPAQMASNAEMFPFDDIIMKCCNQSFASFWPTTINCLALSDVSRQAQCGWQSS